MLMNALTHSQWHQNRLELQKTSQSSTGILIANLTWKYTQADVALRPVMTLVYLIGVYFNCDSQQRLVHLYWPPIYQMHFENMLHTKKLWKQLNVGERKLIIKLFLQVTYRVIQEQTGRCLHTCVNNVGEKKTTKFSKSRDGRKYY